MPAVPSGNVKRIAEAIIVIVNSSERKKRREHSQEPPGELAPVAFAPPTVVDGEPKSQND